MAYSTPTDKMNAPNSTILKLASYDKLIRSNFSEKLQLSLLLKK